MAIKGSERDPAKTCNTDGCNAWATKQSDRTRCRNHGGESTGAPKGNANAVKHGAFRSPEYLLNDIEDTEYEDVFHASFEALCTRHEQMHGTEPDYFDKRRYRRFVLYDIKEDLIGAYLDERTGTSGSKNPLVEAQVRDFDGPMEVEAANKLINYMSDFSREIRLGLKHHGLLRDPESKKASATRSLAEVLRED